MNEILKRKTGEERQSWLEKLTPEEREELVASLNAILVSFMKSFDEFMKAFLKWYDEEILPAAMRLAEAMGEIDWKEVMKNAPQAEVSTEEESLTINHLTK